MVSCLSNENPEKKKIEKKFKNFFFRFFFFLFFSQDFHYILRQETFDMGVFIYLMGGPDCENLKKYMWEGYFRGT